MPRCREQRGTVVELRRDEDAVAGSDELLEATPALGQRLVDERLGVELEQVEEDEHGGATTLLQEREA